MGKQFQNPPKLMPLSKSFHRISGRQDVFLKFSLFELKKELLQVLSNKWYILAKSE